MALRPGDAHTKLIQFLKWMELPEPDMQPLLCDYTSVQCELRIFLSKENPTENEEVFVGEDDCKYGSAKHHACRQALMWLRRFFRSDKRVTEHLNDNVFPDDAESWRLAYAQLEMVNLEYVKQHKSLKCDYDHVLGVQFNLEERLHRTKGVDLATLTKENAELQFDVDCLRKQTQDLQQRIDSHDNIITHLTARKKFYKNKLKSELEHEGSGRGHRDKGKPQVDCCDISSSSDDSLLEIHKSKKRSALKADD